MPSWFRLPSSLRARLILVVVAATIPAFGLLLYNVQERREEARQIARERADHTTALAVDRQKDDVDEARRFLYTIAEVPAVRTGTPDACNQAVSRLALRVPAVYALTRLTATGTMDCSSIPFTSTQVAHDTVADILAVIRTHADAYGPYRQSRRTGEPIMNVTIPVLDGDRLVMLLSASVRLTFFETLAREARVSDGGIVSIWNDQGRMIARLPTDSAATSHSWERHGPYERIRRERTGHMSETGFDGRTRLWAFAPLLTAEGMPAFISVGYPEDLLYASADAYLRKNAIALLLILVLALLLASSMGTAFVSRDVRLLVNATERFATGDLTARTGLADRRGEFGRLGAAFDDMAQRLAERQREYAALADTTLDVITRHDRDGRITYANGATARLFVRPSEWFVGRSLGDVGLPADVLRQWQDGISEVFTSGQPVRLDFLIETNEGGRWFEAQLAGEHGDDGRIVAVLAVSRETTQRRELEAQLLQAQKMETIGQLAGGVAHDFNNLLTAIIGNAEMARDELPPDHPVRDDLQRVLDAAMRSSNLTRQLLAFARRRVLAPRALDLHDALARTRDLLQPIIGEHIELRAAFAEHVPVVTFDPAQLEQVVINLALNARDAMPSGGLLEIGTDADMVLDESAAHRRGVPSGYYAVLEVRDTGTGMTPEVRERIFEPFFTTKGPGHGTGLGLSMVYGTVRQHGGHILVDSEVGVGTTFRLYLPANDAVVPSAVRVDASAVRGGSERILLVEDETEVRNLAARILRSRGYHVREAVHGEDALTQLEESGPDAVDLIITDLIMPRLGGAELIAAVRARTPGLPVIIASGYSREGVPDYLFGQAHTLFVEKPFDAATLLMSVRAAMDGVVTSEQATPRP